MSPLAVGSVVFPVSNFTMAFPSDQRRYSVGASLTGSPPKHPTILPPAAVRASTRISLCTAQPPNTFRIVAESADGALFRVDEMSSAPSSPSTVDGDRKPLQIDTSYAQDLDMDDWARTPLPDRRKLHHSLWPETPGRTPRTADISPPPSRPPPGPPPNIPLPLPPQPLPRRPLPRQPHSSRRDSYKTHSRSFSDSISGSSSARALPPPPLDLTGAKALQAIQKQQQPRVVETERVEHIVHLQTQERLERSERVERHYQHMRGASLSSLPRHPFAVPVSTHGHGQFPQPLSIQTTGSTQHSQGAEVKRSGSRLQRVGRIPAQATPSSTPESTVPPRVFPAPTPATAASAATATTVETEPEEEEEIHFTTVQRAQSVSRAHPAIVVDLAGFTSDETHASHRYAYHDPEGSRLSHGSFGPRAKVNTPASSAPSQRSLTSLRSDSQRSSPSEYSGSGSDGNTAPLRMRKEDAYIPPHRRAGAITPSQAPTQSQLLRAIEAQINDSRPVDFTPAPSPISRRTTRTRGPLVPLRPGVPSTHPLPPAVPPSPKLKGKYPAPIAEAMLALIGRRNHIVQMQETELKKQEADDCSVVELGDAAGDSIRAERAEREKFEQDMVEREKTWREAERKEKESREAERREKYTFKPPRGLLPSVVPSGPPQRPPRSPLRLSTAPIRPPRSDLRTDRPSASSPQTPGVMHDIALTPVAVDFSQPRPYSVSSPRPKKTRSWYAPLKRMSNRGDWAGAKPVKLGSKVDLYEPSDKSSKGSKITLEIPYGATTALPPKSPGLTPRTPRTPRLAQAEAGLLPELARRKASKPPTDDKKRKKRLMIGLGVAVLIVIVILASVLIAKNKQRGHSKPLSEEEQKKQSEEKEKERLREKARDCADVWLSGDGTKFDCGFCFDALATLPNDYVNATSGVKGVGQALQYCTLMELHHRIEDDKNLAMWGESQSPCEDWQGVGCDKQGRVTILELRGPAMPVSMPNLQHLVSLENLLLKGNGSAPMGTLDVRGFANLTLVNAEYTLLQDLKVDNVTSIAFVHNQHLSLPDLSNATISTL